MHLFIYFNQYIYIYSVLLAQLLHVVGEAQRLKLRYVYICMCIRGLRGTAAQAEVRLYMYVYM